MQAQTQLEAAKAAQAYFQKALQELTLFKSKTSAALLQVRMCDAHCLRRTMLMLDSRRAVHSRRREALAMECPDLAHSVDSAVAVKTCTASARAGTCSGRRSRCSWLIRAPNAMHESWSGQFHAEAALTPV